MKILVIKPSSLGDVIHALPFLKSIKDKFPEAVIDWVISSGLKGILEQNPLIHEHILFNKDNWKSIKKLPQSISEISSLRRKLKERRYDIVVDLQGLLRSGLVACVSKAPLKIGFADAREGSSFFYNRVVKTDHSAHAVDKCLEVAAAVGASRTFTGFPLHISTTASARIKEVLGGINEYIVIVPSARWQSKRWPAPYFAQLTENISLPCIIAGSSGDGKIAEKIISAAGSKISSGKDPSIKDAIKPVIIDLCGKTDLKELVALIGGAKAVVSNDSGPMHIAAALNIPTVAIFGPTDPLKTGPYGWETNSNFQVIKTNVPCSPCRTKKCDDLRCMHQVKVETVYNALRKFI